MTDRAYDNNFFSAWIRTRREALKFNEEEFAAALDLSVGVTIMWELGGTCWAQLPRDLKVRLEILCGEFVVLEDRQDFRQATSTLYAEEIQKEVDKLGKKREDPSGSPTFPLKMPLVDDSDYIEFYCSHCGTPVRFKDRERCPECKNLSDSAQ